jgi:hypothetical protein
MGTISHMCKELIAMMITTTESQFFNAFWQVLQHSTTQVPTVLCIYIMQQSKIVILLLFHISGHQRGTRKVPTIMIHKRHQGEKKSYNLITTSKRLSLEPSLLDNTVKHSSSSAKPAFFKSKNVNVLSALHNTKNNTFTL